VPLRQGLQLRDPSLGLVLREMSQSHLNRIFQSIYGVTPGEVRRHAPRKARK
jgi:transcriptional regulator GlxA family with amidase domain